MAIQQSEDKYAQAGDLRIHYSEFGSGEPLFLIHGGGPGSNGLSNYQRNIDSLAQSFRLIVPDMPGFGKSDKPEITGSRFGFYAKAIRDLMDALGIARASLTGYSLGGATTLKFAMEYPERAERLVCIGPAGGATLFQPMPTEGVRVVMGYYGPPGPSKERMADLLRAMLYDHSSLNDDIFEERFQTSMQPELLNAPRSPNATMDDLWKELDRVPQPVLLVWGRDDRVSPMDASITMLQRLPDARLHVFSRCGHWAQWEKAEEFNALVGAFLAARMPVA
jgi:pimeloyl-ACP methyl ester carboxylesterase